MFDQVVEERDERYGTKEYRAPTTHEATFGLMQPLRAASRQLLTEFTFVSDRERQFWQSHAVFVEIRKYARRVWCVEWARYCSEQIKSAVNKGVTYNTNPSWGVRYKKWGVISVINVHTVSWVSSF